MNKIREYIVRELVIKAELCDYLFCAWSLLIMFIITANDYVNVNISNSTLCRLRYYFHNVSYKLATFFYLNNY